LGFDLAVLVYEAKHAGCEDIGASVANQIALLTQACEATAGLIGNTLVAPATHEQISAQVRQQMQAGDVVLVDLAAANCDSAANANPEQFDLLRKARRVFSSCLALAPTNPRASIEALVAPAQMHVCRSSRTKRVYNVDCAQTEPDSA
jgi:hypothetical protein